MANFLIGCALGALVAAFISAPFLAPWPVRVRYLAAAPTADPWMGLAPAPGMQMRAVTVAAVDCERGDVELTLEEIDTGRGPRRRMLMCGSCSASVVAGLDGWAVQRTPLLVVIDERRGVSLYGPDREVTDLVLAEGRVQ